MFRRHYKRRSSNLAFVIFRTLLSLTIFVILALGVYSALTSFSGVDILKGNPQAIIANLLDQKNLTTLLSQILNKKINSDNVNGIQEGASTPTPQSGAKEPSKKAKLAFKFVLIADSHTDNENLKKALAQAKKDTDVKFVIGLGDYTEVGTEAELSQVKQVLDSSGLRYFLTAGDHDLWDSRDKQKEVTYNFTSLFGSPYQSFSYDSVRFIILYNGDNYLGFGKDQLEWLSGEFSRIKQEGGTKLILAFVHEPLYHPSSTRAMGKVEPKLKAEAKSTIKTLKDNQVAEVFAGDVHYFTMYQDPESSLKMTTIGAVTSFRNAQNPRYGVVNIYDDGSYNVEDVEIK